MEPKSDPRLHIVAVTGIIERDGRYLIMKRSDREVAYPGWWTVPGGKLVRHEYEELPKTEGSDGWYRVTEFVLRKEIREETGLEVQDVRYLTDMTFVRPDGIPTLVLSYWCRYASGEIRLGKDLTEHAWVTPAEGEPYRIIPGILDEIRDVDQIVKGI